MPGGGAVEAALAHRLNEKSKAIQGVGQWPYRALAEALKIIPKTLMQVLNIQFSGFLTHLLIERDRGKHWGDGGGV